MTKEEVIKEAYWEYWEIFSDEERELMLKNNGWNDKFNHKIRREMVNFYEIQTLAYGIGTAWRPKSLQGIENNNGWIKIESEADLPKEAGFYYVVDSETGNITDRFFSSDDNGYFYAFSSHYQPIQKPNPPIY